MNDTQTWAEALNISSEKLSEWSSQAPAGQPLLVWCLENGHVSTEEYLAWACENFGLPVLNSAFFHQSFDRETLTAEIRQGPWSAWCFPIGQWDDVSIIACVEPPQETIEGRNCFVLADPAVMHEVWGHIETVVKEIPSEDEQEAPVGINPNATRTFVLNLDDLTGVGEHPSSGEISAVREPNPVEQSEKTGVTLSIVYDKNKPATAQPPPPPATMPKTSSTVARGQKADAPAPAVKAAPAPAAKAAPAAAKATGKAPAVKTQGEEAEIQSGFERLKGDYQSSLIMRCADSVAKPYKWDGDLKFDSNNESTSVNLGFPSFFRIVAKTMQPYHGYVINSPAHQEFFGALNFQSPPACVTAVPLKSGEKLWGILVAFGGEAAQTNEALGTATQVADRLTKALESSWAKSA